VGQVLGGEVGMPIESMFRSMKLDFKIESWRYAGMNIRAQLTVLRLLKGHPVTGA
jgi:hypothetical protein